MAKYRRGHCPELKTPCTLEMSYISNSEVCETENTYRTIKAILLKLGCAVTTIKGELIVGNIKFKGDYTSCLSDLCNHWRMEYCTFHMAVRNQRGWIRLKNYFHLLTYEDYSRGARQAITAIFEKNRHFFAFNSDKNDNFADE